MTRDRQVQSALDILQPDDREKCRSDIIRMLEVVDQVATEETLVSGLTKAKVAMLRHALGKVRSSHRDLPEAIQFELFVDVQKQIDACDVILKQPSKPLKNPAVRQRLAASGAQSLLHDYHMKLVVTRHGAWDRLAAILFGNCDANMLPYISGLKELNDIW